MMKLRALLVVLGILFALNPALAVDYEVSVAVTPEEITTRPCGIATFDIDVENLGEMEDTYSIVVGGIPEDWYSLTHEFMKLEPGMTEKAYLFITPDCYEEVFNHFEASVSVVGQSEDMVNFTLEVVPDHIIEVSMPEEMSVCLGEETTFDVTLENTGEHVEEVVLTLSGDIADFAELSEESVTLEVGEQRDVTVTIKPVEIELGSYALEVEAKSATSYARASASSMVDVTECYAVDVIFPEEVLACVGVATTFEIRVKNVGLKADTYEVRMDELNYAEIIDLEPAASKTIVMDYLSDQEGTFEIDFVVQSEVVKEEGIIKFTVRECYAVDLSVEETEFEIESGKGKLVKGIVRNLGLMADTFKVISDVVWVSIRPEEISLSSNESEDIYAYYSPEYGASGTHITNLTTKSDKSEDTEQITIEVIPKEVVEVEIPTIEEVTTIEEEVTTIEEEVTTTEEEIPTTEEEVTTVEEEEVEPETTVETTELIEIPEVEIPTGEFIGAVESMLGNKVIRSLLIAIIIVIIILIIVYLVVMR